MCNLYHHSVSSSDARLFFANAGYGSASTTIGDNHEPAYVGADADGPIFAVEDDAVVLRRRRWGFPSWKDGGKPITNIRNLESSWWRGANGEYITDPAYRCLIPFDRFAEWDASAKRNAWFSVNAPQSFFAGFWRPWKGERLKSVEGKKRRERQIADWELFAFLTTEPNDTVAAIHPKAMPVILTKSEEAQRWLSGGEESLSLQRPLQDAMIDQSPYDEG
ncbi:MAG: SOS response-associated peptidase family protein [Pontixanthobacter sp.]